MDSLPLIPTVSPPGETERRLKPGILGKFGRRQTVSTLLRELKENGIVERKGQTFAIRQPDRLSTYAQ